MTASAPTPAPAAASTTRESLLDAAESLFSERGYAAVGVREIAEKAGANVASIKYHFGSKRDLYLATVRRVMGRPHITQKWDVLRTPPSDPAEAAVVLVRFIHGFLTEAASTPDACGCLMVRESLQPSEAFDSVINDVIRPQKALLEQVIRQLMPRASEEETARTSSSVLGQILHLRVFHQFYERLHGRSLRSADEVRLAAAHIARFSLRAMRFDESAIETIIKRGMHADAAPASGHDDEGEFT